MPIVVLLALGLVALFILFAYGIARSLRSEPRRNAIPVIAFILATVVMLLSVIEFANVAIFISDTNTPVTQIYGGGIGLFLPWLNLALITSLWVLLGSRLLTRNRYF